MEPTNEIKNKSWLAFNFWDRKKDFKIFKIVAVLAVITASSIIIKDEITWQINSYESDEDVFTDDTYSEESDCNVLGIALHGELVTYIPQSNSDTANENNKSTEDETASEDIVLDIEQVEQDDSIKAIIIDIDSYGGDPVAGEEVSLALKKAKKPIIALIRRTGTSAAYMAAIGADKVFASKNSDIGGIGVTMSYTDYVKQNEKEGITYIPLSAGKFKDAGNPDKILSQEEKNLFMRDINIIHQNFIKMVSENRNLDIEKVKRLADGSTMLGEMALENGLIDQIGGMPEVKEYIKEKIGSDVEICW